MDVDPTIFRPATFIEMSLQNLNRALLIGCVLVILVLIVFLADWRTALISSIAIPLSLLAPALLLHYRGGTLDTMVLAGLVIALGEVVDDAIIDVENIVRRLRLNRGAAEPAAGASTVVLDASLEVRSAVRLRQRDRRAGVRAGVHARRAGRRVLPAAGARPTCSRFVASLRRRADGDAGAVAAAAAEARCGSARIRRWSAGCKARYRRMLPSARRSAAIARSRSSRPRCSCDRRSTCPLLGEEFLPHFREYDFLMHWVEKPGTSLEAMRRITDAREPRADGAIPGVRNFGAHIGRAEVADEVVGPNFTELWISLDPVGGLRSDAWRRSSRSSTAIPVCIATC